MVTSNSRNPWLTATETFPQRVFPKLGFPPSTSRTSSDRMLIVKVKVRRGGVSSGMRAVIPVSRLIPETKVPEAVPLTVGSDL